MRWLSPSLAAIAVVLLAFPAPAKALRVAMPNLTAPQKAVQASVVVTGKVTEIEKESTSAKPDPGSPQKVDYQVANIKITEALSGAKGLTLIRVGFLPNPNQPAQIDNGGGIRPIRPSIGRLGNITLTKDQEGCFFLHKHHEGDFYVLAPNAPPLEKKAETFAKELTDVKKVLKVLEQPMAGLKAKAAEERTFAAGVLITKYRTYPQGVPQAKMEAVPAEESQLILKALAEMEWGKFDPSKPFNMQNLWYSLAVQPKDGWQQPKLTGQPGDAELMQDSIRKWIDGKGKEFRIQRYVVGK